MQKNQASKLKVLALTSIFPNSAQPEHGVFMLHRLAHLAASESVELQVIAPVPWFPFKGRVFGRYSSFARATSLDDSRGLNVSHPRFLAFPKLGMTLSPLLMAISVLPALRDLRRKGFDFDVLDAYYFFPDGVAASILGAILRKPVVVTALGSDVNLIPRYFSARYLIQWSARSCSAITTVCAALRTELIRLGLASSKITVVEHGVDLGIFRPLSDRDATRQRLAVQGWTLVSVGQLVERKGHHIAIEALVALPGTSLLIVGSGPEERRLQRLVRRLGLIDRVKFFGQVKQETLAEIMGAADALVLSSSREGIANVLLEAMACGTPVVATDVWGSPEIVRTPEAGLLVRSRNPAELALRIKQLFSDLPCRQATRRYAERFCWKKTAEQHFAILGASKKADTHR